MLDTESVETITAAADAHINERANKAGASPFPLQGMGRELCVKLMASFACDQVAKALKEVLDGR